ncbi:hypothetical protein BKA61DRAFT_494386 [Leptodontidium sp. MPI-SDFR-AT-0119]|nr:hypothetical protein BKA61DRAFT_494386 [Leptodontidium sp. MPI-SDFR-AT-0119]
MASSSTARHPRRIAGRVDWICVDLGTGGLRMGCSNEGDEDCKEIANYAEAQAGTPSLVPQAPSDIIYEPNDEGPAEPVAFGYARPRKSRRQTVVSKVKIALLPDPESYGYAHSLLVHASDTLRLSSVQQIPEDFLRFAVAHATKECGGQPRKGWVFSVPQSYGIEEVRNFRALIKKAGGIGNIYIHGESDCVTYANLPSIQDIIGEARELAFKQGRNFSVTAGIFDLGAGTADVTTSVICFNVDGTPPTITERRAPLGFAIGGDLFDIRFIDVLRAKLCIDLPLEEEQTLFEPFVDYFHRRSKPRWPTTFEEEEYPFHVPGGMERFVLTEEDMVCIMDPPIDETCQRIGKHLSGLRLQLVVVSGGNSEVPGMMPRLRTMLKKKNIVSADEQVIHLAGQSSNAVIHGLHYWTSHPQLVRGRYARVTLARVVKRHRKELARLRIQIPAPDAEEPDFFDCAERIMTEGDLVPDGTRTVDVYYDIDADAEKFDVHPIVFCIPNEGSQEYTSGPCVWNFASECRLVGMLDIMPTLAGIDVAALRRGPVKGKRRCWLRLGAQVGMDITIKVAWRSDGRKPKDETGLCSSTLTLNNLELPNDGLVKEFRTPIQQRESCNSSISTDTLPGHLERLRTAAGTKDLSQQTILTPAPSSSSEYITL